MHYWDSWDVNKTCRLVFDPAEGSTAHKMSVISLTEKQCKIVKGNTVFPFMLLLVKILLYALVADQKSGSIVTLFTLFTKHVRYCTGAWCVTMLTQYTDVNKCHPTYSSVCVCTRRIPNPEPISQSSNSAAQIGFWKFPCPAAGWAGLNVEI